MLRLTPMTITRAKEYVAKNHRHNIAPQGALFAVGASNGDELCGVAIVGRPISRMLQDGKTCEVIRLCTDGSSNACSLLYGACARAAKSLGYERIITYTLESEGGASLKASGWMVDATNVGLTPWSTSKVRKRHDFIENLFGKEQKRPNEPKVRWKKTFTQEK